VVICLECDANDLHMAQLKQASVYNDIKKYIVNYKSLILQHIFPSDIAYLVSCGCSKFFAPSPLIDNI